jgi:RNA polymerase sigma factor (sigma-70 family)
LNLVDTKEKTQPAAELSFEALVAQCQSMVFNTALSMVQNEVDAEDITQDVFIEVYEGLGTFRQESKLSTWIYRITVNKSLDHLKKQQRRKNGGLLKRIFSIQEEDEPASFEHPGVQLDKKESSKALFGALKKLPHNQQVAFTLHKIEGLNQRDTAAIMETSVEAVESLLGRAKNNLRKHLEIFYQKQHG